MLRPCTSDREIVYDRAESRTFATKHSSQEVAGATVPLRHAHRHAPLSEDLQRAPLTSVWINMAPAPSSASTFASRATTTYALWPVPAHDICGGGVSDSLAAAPSRSRTAKVHSTRKFLAILDSCKATCTTSSRRTAYALKLPIGRELRQVGASRARRGRVLLLPARDGCVQRSSRAPPSQRPRSRQLYWATREYASIPGRARSDRQARGKVEAAAVLSLSLFFLPHPLRRA